MIPGKKKPLLEEAWDSLDVIGSTDRPVRHFFLRCLALILLLVTAVVITAYFMAPLLMVFAKSLPIGWRIIGGVWAFLNGVGFIAFITQDGFSDGG